MPTKEGEEHIELENLTKMEGHGSLDIMIKDKKGRYARLR